MKLAMDVFGRHFFIGFLAAVVFGLSSPAASASGPGGDVFFGYSRLGNDTFYANAGGLNGWDFDGHIKLNRYLGVEGDLAHYGFGASSTPHTTTVMFGPRVTLGVRAVHVFVRGLLGGEHSSSSGPNSISGGALTDDFGGGVDLRFAPFLAWRAAVDYLDAPGNSPGSGSHDRFTTGLVFRF